MRKFKHRLLRLLFAGMCIALMGGISSSCGSLHGYGGVESDYYWNGPGGGKGHGKKHGKKPHKSKRHKHHHHDDDDGCVTPDDIARNADE